MITHLCASFDAVQDRIFLAKILYIKVAWIRVLPVKDYINLTPLLLQPLPFSLIIKKKDQVHLF